MADLFDNLLSQLQQSQAGSSVPQALPSPAGSGVTPDSNPQLPANTAAPVQAQPQASPQAAQQDQAPKDPFDQLLASQAQQKVQNLGPDEDGSMDKPINQSPLSAQDRAKLSLGNTRGGISYLKKRFEDAAFTEKNGLIVQSGGAWHKVDPSGAGQYFKDPWELTKDIADLTGDAVVIAGASMPAAKGAIAGSATGAEVGSAFGPVGTAVGGAIGGAIGGASGAGVGGSAGSALRTSLGRLVGTYEADPVEQIHDIGLEGLMMAGGEVIGLGAKPALGQIAKAAKFIGKTGSEAAVDTLSSALGTTTGAGKPAIKAIIDNPDGYASVYKSIAAGAESSEDIINRAKTQQMDHAETLLSSASDALPKKYGQLLDDLVEKAGSKNIKVNVGDVLDSAAKAVSDNGFGRIIAKDDSFKFIPFGPAEIQERVAAGKAVDLVDDKATAEINQIVAKMSNFASLGEIKGPGAAKALQIMNKSLTQIASDAYKGELSPATARAISKVAEGFRNGVSAQFEKNGLGEEYGKMQQLYSTYANSVNQARSILKSQNGLETLTNKLSSAAGKNMTAKGDVSLLLDLAGSQGEAAYKNIVMADAVKNTASWAPKIGMANAAIGATAAMKMGFAAAMHNPLGVGLVATQFSPRIVANEVRAGAKIAQGVVGAGTKAVDNPIVNYAFKSLDFLRGLSFQGLRQWLNNPQAISTVFKTPEDAAQGEQQGVQQLLQQHGVIPGGQQQ